MFCLKCGSEMPEGKTFCGNCGAQLRESQVQPMLDEAVPEAPAAPEKKKSGKKLIAGIGALALCLAIAIVAVIVSSGRSGGETTVAQEPSAAQSGETVQEDTKEQNLTEDQEAAVDQTSDNQENSATLAEADAAFAELVEEMMQAVENDSLEDFSALYVNREAYTDTIQSDFDSLKDRYSDYSARILPMTLGKYPLGFLYRSSCAGTYPDESISWAAKWFPLSWQDGKLRVDWTDESTASYADYTLPFPDDVFAALEEKRNFRTFNDNDYSWMFEDVVAPGGMISQPYALWQNEDGSVDCFISAKNGTSETRAVTYTTLTVVNEDTGETVCEYTDEESHFVEPGHSITYTVHIPANQVRTGTDPWGAMSYDLSCGRK